MSTERTEDIAAKAEALVRIAVDLGHLCVLRRWHDPSWCMTVFQCDAAPWLVDQQRYGHILHVRETVTDQKIASAHDPHFLLADAAYYVVTSALRERGLWDEVIAEFTTRHTAISQT